MTNWNEPAVFFASWNAFALKNAALLTVSHIPVLFLAYCALAHPATWQKYKKNIFFAAAVQCIGVLPTYVYVIFHFFITLNGFDFATNHFWCTMSRSIFGTIAYASFQAPTAISICRYFVIAHLKPFRLRDVALISVSTASITLAHCFYALAWGMPIRGTSCSSIAKIPSPLCVAYHCSLIAFSLTSLPLNLLLIRRIQKTLRVWSTARSVDELSLTYGLLVQGCVPCLIISLSVAYNALLLQGAQFSLAVRALMDSTGYLVLGVNTFFSFVFIRAFRNHLFALFGTIPLFSRLLWTSSGSSTRLAMSES